MIAAAAYRRQGSASGRPPALSTPSFLHPPYPCPAEQTNDALSLKQTQLVPVHGLWPLLPLPPFVSFSHPSAAFIRKRLRMSFQRPSPSHLPLRAACHPVHCALPHSHTLLPILLSPSLCLPSLHCWCCPPNARCLVMLLPLCLCPLYTVICRIGRPAACLLNWFHVPRLYVIRYGWLNTVGFTADEAARGQHGQHGGRCLMGGA